MVSKRSVNRHFPVSGCCTHTGRPRRVSSIPSTAVGAGSAIRASACATQAACPIGQLTRPSQAPLTAIPSATRPATWRRNRPVSRAPAGTSGMASVNAFRGQRRSRQKYCVLCQRTASGASP